MVVEDPGGPDDNGLCHDGGAAKLEEEEEEIEVEEMLADEQADVEFTPNVVRVPRVPTAKEREIHEALHIPHAEWCEFCVRGRARNKPHGHKAPTGANMIDMEGGKKFKIN